MGYELLSGSIAATRPPDQSECLCRDCILELGTGPLVYESSEPPRPAEGTRHVKKRCPQRVKTAWKTLFSSRSVHGRPCVKRSQWQCIESANKSSRCTTVRVTGDMVK